MRVNLQTLGCRLNEAELQTWARQLQREGHLVTTDQAAADLVVINTCAVTAEAVRKSRKLLRRARRANPDAKLVVSGCFASLEARALARDPDLDLLIPNGDKDDLVRIATRELGLSASPQAAGEPDTDSLFARGRQRAFVKVQDGCRYRCAFCVVTLARGEERSRPMSEVVEEINRLGAGGVKEVVLTGVHLGGYGSDSGSDLAALVRAALADTDMPRLRMGSLEPWGLPDGFWRLFESPRLMPHLHLPVQSGSDAVLRRMARRGRSEELARLLAAARQQVADFVPTTDIIAGFPGETESEWRATLTLVESLGFGQVHVFPFSPRPGTKAAALPGQIAAETKKERSRQMQTLGRRLKRDTLARFVGRRLPVLVEGRYGGASDGAWFGYTPNYLPVMVRTGTAQDLLNRIRDVRLEGIEEESQSLIARL